MRIEYHRTLIADGVRNEAFRRALAAVIVPGVTTVADIGAGTGILGLIASRLGAREVYLYETAEVAGVAAKVLRVNRARNCHLMPCHSAEMVDPPRVDVVVTETLGNYALEEDILETVRDARARHLKPEGKIVPRRITQFVAPVVSSRFHDELSAWDRTGLDLDLSPARVMSFNNIYVRSFGRGDLLAEPGAVVAWDDIDLARDNRGVRRGEASWRVARSTVIYGFAVWWTAELAPGILLSTAPEAPRTHWEQLYLPVPAPMAVAPGETLALSLRTRSSREAGTHVAWTSTHLDAAGGRRSRQALDLDKGFLP